jgi:acyl-CoA synthetase (AMP-forming)/AMP-acid ligase II
MNVARSARLFADVPAIMFEGRTLSYRELDGRATRAAHALEALGIRPGGRVASFLPNVPDFAAAYQPAMKASPPPCR